METHRNFFIFASLLLRLLSMMVLPISFMKQGCSSSMLWHLLVKCSCSWLKKMSTTLLNFRKSFCTFRLHLQMGQKQWVVSFSEAAVQNGKNKLRWRRVRIQCLFWLMDFISPLSPRPVSLLCLTIFLSVLSGSPSKDVHFFLECFLIAERRTTAFHITNGNH